MTPNTIKIDEVEYVRKDRAQAYTARKEGPWEIGKAYFVLTVTMGIHGVLVNVTDQELVLMDAAWIADTGRFHRWLKGEIKPNEVEPFPRNMEIPVGRGALIVAIPVQGSFPEAV